MDNREADLSGLIRRALEEHAKLSEYSEYSPIYNSKLMLNEIDTRVENKILSVSEEQKLNVGLLAAKSLDFDDRFKKYALLLHHVWYKFLVFFNKIKVIPLSGCERDAYNFYLHHKFIHNQIVNHLYGIDFNKPIDVNYKIRKSIAVTQWKALRILQGNYYANKNILIQTNLPSCLGIHDKQEDDLGNETARIEHHFELQSDVIFLKSIAAPVLDTWSVKMTNGQQGFPTTGGCTQYFNANDKVQCRQISP